MHSQNTYFKNDYLTCQTSKSLSEYVEASISILKPFPEFFISPVLDILAQALASGSKLAIRVPNDQRLEEILVAVGCKSQIVGSEEFLTLVSEALVHPINFRSAQYFQFTSEQERFYLGLPASGSKSSLVFTPPENLHFVPQNRKTLDFDTIVNKRSSSTHFGHPITKEICDLVLRDCYYLRSNGTNPVSSAGGFPTVKFYFATSGLTNLDKGIYEISNNTTAWKQLESEDYVCALNDVSFQQEYTIDCRNYFIALLDLKEMSEKYGSRSHRFAFTGLGCTLERMHLSATSHQLNFRIIGGFDEMVLKKLLGIHSQTTLVGALIAFG